MTRGTAVHERVRALEQPIDTSERRVDDAGDDRRTAVTIRRATSADASALARLRFAFRSGMGEPTVEAEDRFVERCARWMASRLSDERRWWCWVAERDGRLLGHVWLHWLEKVPNPVDEPEEHAYITNMYVIETARGLGTGSRLLATALDACRARGVDAAILWPSRRSRPFYERHGFTVSDDVMRLVVRAGSTPAAERRKPMHRHAGSESDR